jgi:hypothetical protein
VLAAVRPRITRVVRESSAYFVAKENATAHPSNAARQSGAMLEMIRLSPDVRAAVWS